MGVVVPYRGKIYTVEFYRSGKVSEIKLGKSVIWTPFSTKTQRPVILPVIAMATAMREDKLAFSPQFPMMR